MNLKWTWRKSLLITFVFASGAAWFWLAASPAHWFRRVDYGIVRVDGRRVDADIFFATPEGEAEAVVLVHIKEGGDYFLDFGTENWKQGNSSEYFRLLSGVWSLHPVPESLYPEQEPLPFRNLNEFRIPTHDGHEISVQL